MKYHNLKSIILIYVRIIKGRWHMCIFSYRVRIIILAFALSVFRNAIPSFSTLRHFASTTNVSAHVIRVLSMQALLYLIVHANCRCASRNFDTLRIVVVGCFAICVSSKLLISDMRIWKVSMFSVQDFL